MTLKIIVIGVLVAVVVVALLTLIELGGGMWGGVGDESPDYTPKLPPSIGAAAAS